MLDIPTGGAELRRVSEELIAECLRDAGADALSAEQLAPSIRAIAERHEIPVLAILWWIENESQAAQHSTREWSRWAQRYEAARDRLQQQNTQPPPQAA